MLSYWMTWEAASHIVFVCKQLLLDLQTEGEAIQEVLEVVIVALVTPVVVQEVVGLLDRGKPFFDNITFDLLTLNTATEGTELPLRKLPTYSDSRIHYQFSVGEEVADEAAIMAVLVQLTAILFMVCTITHK